MANSQPVFEYNDESQADRLARKSKDSPFMIIGKKKLVFRNHVSGIPEHFGT